MSLNFCISITTIRGKIQHNASFRHFRSENIIRLQMQQFPNCILKEVVKSHKNICFSTNNWLLWPSNTWCKTTKKRVKQRTLYHKQTFLLVWKLKQEGVIYEVNKMSCWQEIVKFLAVLHSSYNSLIIGVDGQFI